MKAFVYFGIFAIALILTVEYFTDALGMFTKQSVSTVRVSKSTINDCREAFRQYQNGNLEVK
jgi:hypothetical protein